MKRNLVAFGNAWRWLDALVRAAVSVMSWVGIRLGGLCKHSERSFESVICDF